MADRGKRAMSAEELRREREEEERRQRRDENISWWWETQHDTVPFPPVPPGFSPIRTHDCTQGNLFAPSEPHRLGLGEYFRTKPRARVMPGTYLGIPRDPCVPTDKVDPQALRNFWAKIQAPPSPTAGPWYRFVDGYVQFCYGVPWERLHQREVDMALYVKRRRTEGIVEVPAAPQPHEVMLYIVETIGEIVRLEEVNDDDDPMEWNEPVMEEEAGEEGEEQEEEEDEEEEDEDVKIEEFIDDDEEETDDDDSEEDEIPVGSDTSTITEAPSKVPRRHRHLRRGPRRR